MPKITIKTPFNYQSGGETTHYKKGEQEVPQAVADHALARGFAANPSTVDKPAEPATKA
ncbi:hypothetical protein [Pseudomonas sp. LRF_L74]|uniref:hypothetical protein n=1 Tax=Pseudomonas sp. LRF_L74 TaxID=3369422 RepID=UPI003F5E3C7A